MTWLPAFFIGWILGAVFMHVIDRAFLLEWRIRRFMRHERAETAKSIAEVPDK